MKITELDLQIEGKRYFCKQINEVVEVKDGNIVGTKKNLNLASLLHMDFEEYTSKANPYTRLDIYNTYYYIAADSQVVPSSDDRLILDDEVFEAANYFNSKNYAEYIAFKETLMRKIDKFAWENNAKVIDWNNDSSAKCYITFSNVCNEFITDWNSSYRSNDIYFTSKEIAKQAIEEFKEDLIKLYTWKF